MKKFSMSIGIVILAMLIGLTMTACQNPAGGGKKARTGPGEVVPAITGVSAATTIISVAGGTSEITVAGSNLVDDITVTAFDGELATEITGTTSGSGTSQTVTLNFPKNASTTANKVYTVKASLDGGINWVTQTATVTVSKGNPAITNVSAATTTFVAAGGTSEITVTGTYLADGIKVTAFDGATETSITGTTSGSGASQTVTLTFPVNTSAMADKIYTVKASFDGGTTWAAQTAAVIVSKGDPAITNVSAATTTFVAAGGNSMITVTGTYLADGIKVTAFDGASETDITGTTSGSGTSQTVTLTFPVNTSAMADKAYTVKASLNGGINWVTQTATVTVSKAVGWTGPAGGIVFFDKGETTDGWRYLEAAPAATEFQAAWATSESIGDLGTQTGVGTGKENTRLIVEALNSAGETDSAAQRCVSLSFGGYTDWFLPSVDELSLMYKNLKVNGLGGFTDGEYWSSSENPDNRERVWLQVFESGVQTHYQKSHTNYVRAIRAF